MDKKVLFSVAFILSLGMPSGVFAGQKASVRDFRITRQCDPWREVKGSFRAFTSKNLFNLIDGGAPEYIENGFVQGIFQRLQTPDSATIEIFFEDFGAPEHAQKMFDVKRKGVSEACSFSDLDTSKLGCAVVIGGFAAYGVADRFYFELALMGMKENEKADKAISRIYNHVRGTVLRKK